MNRIVFASVLTMILTFLFPAPVPAETFEITSIEYGIVGRTRVWAVKDKLRLTEGQQFADRDELEAYLTDQQQLLINERVLDYALVEYDESVDDPDTDEREILVRVETEDTWNYFILPYFKYDSNTGLLLSLRGRDYNFFGTMKELEIDLDYEKTEDLEDLVTIAANFSIPLNILERRWRLAMKQELVLEADEVAYLFDLGFGYDFDWLSQTWTTTYTQSYRYDSDDEFDDTSYFGSRVDFASDIETPVNVPGFGALRYRPNLYSATEYKPGGISDERSGLRVGYEHSLFAGRIDWIGNYRNGTTARVGNDNSFETFDQEWSNDVNFAIAGYRSWLKAGVSGRASGFYLITGADEDQSDAAKAARGVLNDDMNGDVGLFLNLDATVTFWTLRPIFEAQVGVFFDTAYVRDTEGAFYGDTSFEAERDLLFGSGIEVVGFPLFARSLYIRASLGSNVRAVLDGANPLSSEAREIFFGLGHHY